MEKQKKYAFSSTVDYYWQIAKLKLLHWGVVIYILDNLDNIRNSCDVLWWGFYRSLNQCVMKCEMALYCVFALSLTSNISICALTTVFARSDRWQNFWQNVQNKANSGELSWLFDLNERINQPTATSVTFRFFYLQTNCHFPGFRYHYYLFLKGIMIQYSAFRFCSFDLMTSMHWHCNVGISNQGKFTML